MAGDDLGAERDLDPVDIALDRHLLVGVHRRRRVVHQDPRHRKGGVVVEDRARNPAEEGEGADMAVEEGLGRVVSGPGRRRGR